MINNDLKDKDLPVFGDGMQVRDLHHVSGHCYTIDTVLYKSRDREVYISGGNNKKPTLKL